MDEESNDESGRSVLSKPVDKFTLTDQHKPKIRIGDLHSTLVADLRTTSAGASRFLNSFKAAMNPD